MRDIEDLFKESLKDHQLPYDGKAWSNMSKKLDAKNSSTSNGTKWMLGAAGILAIVATYLFVTAENVSESPIKEHSKTAVDKKNILESPIEEASQVDAAIISVNEKVEKTENKTGEVKIKKETNHVNEEIKLDIIDQQIIADLISPVYREVESPSIAVANEAQVKFHFNKTPNQCLNSTVSYSNTNKESIWMRLPSSALLEIPANSDTDFIVNEKGSYLIGNMNKENEFIASTSFRVDEAQEIQVSAEDYLDFKNGLPELTVQAYAEGQIEWKLNQELTSKTRKKEKFNLFDRGNYNITGILTDINGCKSEARVTHNIEKNYNLLAVNAFTPNSANNRNTTFMPFALTKRNTPFKMFVIDPSNGAVIFETSNADQAWEGINKNTGVLVEKNKSFVWKVILQQPEKGESPEYMGTIVLL